MSKPTEAPPLRCRIFGHRMLAYITIRQPVYYAACPHCGAEPPRHLYVYGGARPTRRWRG